ncbi:MAG TPA: STAS/SEC14 domain-containing protein [Candidatus Angelobacter sp.]|nr:STAS/SEC14 domain-containing protein [Candidatus Angelobacter sp.]
MSAEIVNDTASTLTLKITGKLNQPELADAQKRVAELLQREGKKHLLIIAENFQGWGKGDWGDLSGQMMMEPYIDRMAIVGERKWENLTLMFTGKGIRRLPIEFFPTGEMSKAQAWLENG